jgi:hypothetical protein
MNEAVCLLLMCQSCIIALIGMIRCVVFLLHVNYAMTGWNLESRTDCYPARFVTEGGGYCSEKMDGWDAWGVSTETNIDTGKGTCSHVNYGGCRCDDCGPGMTYCKDIRCDDKIGEETYNRVKNKWECWEHGKTNVQAETYGYPFCYGHRSKCDLTPCLRGQYLSGCMRASAGTCVSCPVAVTIGDQFWGAVGHGAASCKLIQCSIPAPGQFIKTACISNADTVIKSCAEYPGNKKSTNDMSPAQLAAVTAGQKGVFDTDHFYCPAGNLPLALPANAITSNYITFECKAGFYLSEGSCFQCPPGSACVNGKQYVCPINYYSKAFASSECILCTSSCKKNSNKRPLRCKAGSTFDSGCVSCGACGSTADVGLWCVENDYEMMQLKTTCAPSSSGEWHCSNRLTP